MELEKLDFNTLKELAQRNNLRFNYKKKEAIIAQLKAHGITSLDHNEIPLAQQMAELSISPETKLATQMSTMSLNRQENWEISPSSDEDEAPSTSSGGKSVQVPKEDVIRLKTLVSKLRTNARLTELERAQHYVFNQLGII